MRIVHVVRSDAFAGVECFVARLGRAQAEHGHEVIVIGGDSHAMQDGLGPTVMDHVTASTTAQAALALRRRPRFDVVNVHMTAAEVAAAAALFTMAGPRPAVVATRHFAQRRGIGSVGVVRPAIHVAARRIDAQIAVSRHVADHIEGASTVVYPGVGSRPETGSARDRERTVLMVQRLEPEKETERGIDAFLASGLVHQGWRLLIAGTGSRRGALERHLHDVGVEDSVELLGFRSDTDSLMSRAGILLASCPNEHFGLSVLEAMASGLPVVAADAGGHRETLADLDARALYPPLDTQRCGAQLADLASDPAGRDALARAARERQQSLFSIEAQERATDAVYRSVL